MVGLEQRQRVGDNGREDVVGLVVDRVVAGGAQHRVHLPDRERQGERQLHHHLGARTRTPRLEEADVPRRHIGDERQVELTHATPPAPVLEQRREEPGAAVEIGHRSSQLDEVVGSPHRTAR